MQTKTYNGWTNYETWLVALWIDNEEGTYRERCDLVEHTWKDADVEGIVGPSGDFTRSERARYELTNRVKDMIEDSQPDLNATLWADLLNAAMSAVNWLEIADEWLTECDGYEQLEKAG